MNTDEIESSDYRATPVRFFEFTMGNRRWLYVGNSSQPVAFGLDNYIPDPVLAMGEISTSLGESPPTVEVTISSQSEVARMHVPYMPAQKVFVRVSREQEVEAPGVLVTEFIGEVTTSAFDEQTGTCRLSAKMASAALARPVPWPAVCTTCTYALYGAGCRVDRELFKTSATLTGGAETTAISAPQFATAGAGHPMQATWFRNGHVRHVASGEVRSVLEQDGGTLYLQAPFVNAAIGDEVEAFAGCSRLRDMCRDKFNNYPRWSGFPWVPQSNPYTQNVFGTGADSFAGKPNLPGGSLMPFGGK